MDYTCLLCFGFLFCLSFISLWQYWEGKLDVDCWLMLVEDR